jgi:hypothetical protein
MLHPWPSSVPFSAHSCSSCRHLFILLISQNLPFLQDEDVMDKFGEYGTVKAGDPCACGIVSFCFSHVGLQ